MQAGANNNTTSLVCRPPPTYQNGPGAEVSIQLILNLIKNDL